MRHPPIDPRASRRDTGGLSNWLAEPVAVLIRNDGRRTMVRMDDASPVVRGVRWVLRLLSWAVGSR